MTDNTEEQPELHEYLCKEGRRFILEDDAPMKLFAGGEEHYECFGCPRITHANDGTFITQPLVICFIARTDIRSMDEEDGEEEPEETY